MIGLQSFIQKQQGDRQQAKMNLGTALGSIAFQVSSIPFPWSLAPAALLAAQAQSNYATAMGIINSAFYPPPTGFALGGLVQGGVQGIDSVPALLQPGELVVPTKNFDEVIRSVSQEREKNNLSSPIHINLNIDGQFMNDSEEFSENLVETIKDPLTDLVQEVFDKRIDTLNE